MSPIVAPVEADRALGSSITFDEQRGDLARAVSLTEDALRLARTAGDPDALADALLSRASVAIVQGESRAALALLAELNAVATHSAERDFRALTLAALACCHDANTFPDGTGANGVELQPLMASLLNQLGTTHTGQRTLRPQVRDSRVKQEGALVSRMIGHQSLRSAAARRGVGTDTGEVADALNAVLVSEVSTLVDEIGDSEDPLVHGALLRRAVEMTRLARSDAAALHARALAVYEAAGDDVGTGMCNLDAGDARLATVSSPLIWNVALSEGTMTGSDLSWVVEERELDRGTGDLSAARAAYDAAEAAFRRAGAQGVRGLAAVMLRRTCLAVLGGDHTEALHCASAARERFARALDVRGEWLARVQESLLRIWCDPFANEEETARAAGAWGRSTGSFSHAFGLGLFAGRIARVWLMRHGDYVRALAGYRFAERLYDALGATENVAQSIVDQATVYSVIGDQAEAVTRLERALEVRAARAHGDAWSLMRELSALRDLYQLALEAKDPDRMERAAERVGAMLERGARGDDPMLAAPLHAFHEMLQSLVGQTRVLAPLYRADRAREQGNETRALILLDQAYRALQTIPEDQRDFLEATVHAHARNWDAAAAAYRRMRKRSSGGVLEFIAEGLGGAPASFLEHERVRQTEREHARAALFFTRVRAYADALVEWEWLEQNSGPRWWMREERPWDTAADHGEACEGAGQLDRALVLYDQGMHELERRRGLLTRDELRTSLAGGKGTEWLYFMAVRTVAKLHRRAREAGDTAAADLLEARLVDYAERGRARALLDLVAAGVGPSRASVESLLARQWRELGSLVRVQRTLLARAQSEAARGDAGSARAADLAQKLAAAEREWTAVEQRVAESDPTFFQSLTASGDVLSLENLRTRLAPGTTLLQFQFLGDDFIAWALSADGLVHLHQAAVDTRALAARVRRFHRLCDTVAEQWEQLAGELAQQFLEPFHQVIADSKRLIIVPFGAAHELPFHALPWRGAPLSNQVVVSYLPSASMLAHVRSDAPITDLRILAVGDPRNPQHHEPLSGTTDALDPLPGAALEAAYAAHLGRPSALLWYADATEEAVRRRLAVFPVVHFAAHGILSTESPLLSSIVLADGDELSVYELVAVRLDADLVILSACDSARGERTGGDEVVGLTRGLIAAGARSALVTLWPVADDAAALLTAHFYERILAQQPPAHALQQAQRYLRTLTWERRADDLARIRGIAAERLRAIDADATDVLLEELEDDEAGVRSPLPFDHPSYWAPFVLVG